MGVLVDWKQATPFWQGLSEENKSHMGDLLRMAVADRKLSLNSPWGDRWTRASVCDPWRVIPKGAVLKMSEDAGHRLATYSGDVRSDMQPFLGERPSTAYVVRFVCANGDTWHRASVDDVWRVTPAGPPTDEALRVVCANGDTWERESVDEPWRVTPAEG